MKITVRELVQMLKEGHLHTEQTTQRSFVYNSMETQLTCGTVTKAGAVINSILEKNIQLPAIYFWYNSNTGMTNLHDGKQRVLSIYNFIEQNNVPVTTYINGKQICSFNALSADLQEKLLNYTLDVVERTGTSLEEEESFFLLNTNSVNLTPYECLRGMLYGTFFIDFENFIGAKAKILDKVKEIGRGEQAYKILMTALNIKDSKRRTDNSASMQLLQDTIRPIRNSGFNAETYALNEILEVFNELSRIIIGAKEERMLAVASFIVRNAYNTEEIVDLYRRTLRNINDIKTWDLTTHETFMRAFVEDTIELDGKRFFTTDDKDALYRKNGRCAHVDPETGISCKENNYKKLEVDHIIPWSRGGRTTLDNGQLLCKTHNASKGNKN